MRLATGLALLLGIVAGVAGDGFAARRLALAITALQVTSKDTRTAVEIRRDLDRKP